MKRVDKPAPVTVTVEFTEREAKILCALVGGIRGVYFGNPVSDTTKGLYEILNDATPDRKASFTDLFEGDVKVKQAVKL